MRVAQAGKVSAAQTREPGSDSRHHIKNQALWQKLVISVLRKGMEADTWSWPSRQPGLAGKSQVLVRDQFQKARRAAPEGQHPGLTSGLHMHVHANPHVHFWMLCYFVISFDVSHNPSVLDFIDELEN